MRRGSWRAPGRGPFPAVLVLHTRGGLNAHARAAASWFAAQGFVAYAPDYFSPIGMTPLSFDRQTFTAQHGDAVLEHLSRAADCLRDRTDVVRERVGVVGFSLGGYFAVLLATREGFVGAAAWYAAFAGSPVNQVAAQRSWSDVAGAVRAPVLILHGAEDADVRADFAGRAQAELERRGKRSQLVVYPGVGHGYDQEGSPLYRYDAAATADSRARTLALLGAAR